MPDRARHRVAAERAEELHAVVERVGDGARRRDRADRMAVAERLAHHDDVGHDALILERPEARAHAAEPGLHFVGDAHAAAGAHVLVHVRRDSRGGSTSCPPTLGHVSAMNAARPRPSLAQLVDDRRRRATRTSRRRRDRRA